MGTGKGGYSCPDVNLPKKKDQQEFGQFVLRSQLNLTALKSALRPISRLVLGGFLANNSQKGKLPAS